ncbi:Lysophosphatidylcholine acyltransferase 1 [Halotydeus destructor]|nr:Lysophosphatidylcholine acyltransferase 1 [Halotydeus destructor]
MKPKMDNLCANPFVVKNKWTFLNYLKITLMACFIFPIRCLLILLITLVFLILTHVLYYWKTYIHRPTDYNSVRPKYLYLPIKMLRLMSIVCGIWKIKYEDKSNKTDPTKPAILIVVPHSALWDLMAVGMIGEPIYVARHQASTSWFIGKLVKLSNPILVKRDDIGSRQDTLKEIADRAKNGETVLLLPEGTCTNRTMILRFKPGAFRPGLPLQPIFLKYDLDDNIDNLSWTWEGPSSAGSVFLTLCKFYTSLTLIKYPVISPIAEEKVNASLFAETVHRRICQWSKTRHSLYSLDDVVFLQFAKFALIPRSPVCLKFINISCKLLSCYVTNKDQDPRTTSTAKIALWYIRTSQVDNNVAVGDKIRFNLINEKKVNEKKALYYTLISLIDKAKKNLAKAGKRRLDGKDDIMKLLDIHEVTPVKNSSVMEDFLYAFGLQYSIEVTTVHLLVIVCLCDPRTPLWDRVRECMTLMAKSKKEQFMTNGAFKLFIWYLLGLESQLIDDTVLAKQPLNYEFAEQKLVKLFKRAVKENAESLRLKNKTYLDFTDSQLVSLLSGPTN